MGDESRPEAREDQTEWRIAAVQFGAEVISDRITGDLARSAELP